VSNIDFIQGVICPPSPVERSPIDSCPSRRIIEPYFWSTLGVPEKDGSHSTHYATRSGIGQTSNMHGVGEDAPCIVDHLERVFGGELGLRHESGVNHAGEFVNLTKF